MRSRIESLERQLEQANERDRENRRIIAALTSRIPEIEAPRTTQPESPASPPMGHSGEPQQQAEASADGQPADDAILVGSVTSFLPTPRDKLPFLSYVASVIAAAPPFIGLVPGL
jgi:hypothetical protein